MIADERRYEILRTINHKGYVKIKELSNEFGTSEMTIRRDLDILEKNGLVERLHGGAVFSQGKVGNETHFEKRQSDNLPNKQAIALYASHLIAEGDCIAIDIGTTAFELAKIVSGYSNLTVITASIPVVNELMVSESISVISTGGEVSRRDKSLVGNDAVRTINEYVLDKVFLSVAGISLNHGFTLFSRHDTFIKRALVARTNKVVVLADSTKFGLTRHSFLMDISKADLVITDTGIPVNYLTELRSIGVQVVTVDENGHSVELDLVSKPDIDSR